MSLAKTPLSKMQIVIDPELLKTYGFYGGLLVAKMLFMSPYTVYHRRKKLVREGGGVRGGRKRLNQLCC